MKLSEYALKKGICYMTAVRMAKSGRIPKCKKLNNGRYYIDVESESESILHERLDKIESMLSNITTILEKN